MVEIVLWLLAGMAFLLLTAAAAVGLGALALRHYQQPGHPWWAD